MVLVHDLRLSHLLTHSGEQLDALIAAARADGQRGRLPYLLAEGAYLDFGRCHWLSAAARATEAATLAAAADDGDAHAWALVTLARLDAAQGFAGRCRDHAAGALDLARRYGNVLTELHARIVLGFLELSVGEIPAALAQLESCSAQASRLGFVSSSALPFAPDLVEALCAAGRPREAAEAAASIARSSNWGEATAARCRGLLAGDDRFDAEFQAALAWHEGLPHPFERARTHLRYGERLRRVRHRVEARAQLSAALAVFERLDATPWAERARRELYATGMTARSRRDPTTVDHLTPQEENVALILAEGATVREAAARLFLSPKTIEAHVSRVYRKLGVHNRAQLTGTLTHLRVTG